MKLQIFLQLTILTTSAISSNILMYVGLGLPSHQSIYKTFAKALASKGHNITFIAGFKMSTEVTENITMIVPETFLPLKVPRSPVEDRINGLTVVDIYERLPDLELEYCEAILNMPQVRDLVRNDGQKFDLLILNTVFSDCGLGFIDAFKIPAMHFCTSGLYDWNTPLYGSPLMTNYKGSIMAVTSQDVTQFSQRMVTTLATIYMRLAQYFYEYPRMEGFWRSARGVEDVQSFIDAEDSVYLMLMNTHIVIEPPMPYLPNMIEVGGMHMTKPKGLPKDLYDFVESSGSDGFIYFSLGSLVNEEDLTVQMLRSLLKAFSQYPQKVIWKWKGEDMKGLAIPQNVKISKWVPQNDILAHPKIRLFITHGGKLGSFEAITYGVPLIVVPIFSDQDTNAFLSQKNGYGLKLEITDLESTEIVMSLISEVLNNEKYKKKALEYSAILNDKLRPPMDTAIYWVEYLIRHRDAAPSLKNSSRKLWWFQRHLFDVYAALILILTMFSYLIVRLLRICKK